VSLSDLVTLIVGAVQGVGGIAIFLLVVMIGFCLLLDSTKFRPTRNSRTVKSLDELTGAPIQYLPPDVPRGPSDQLGGSRRSA
jgi:hypothetical protein